MSPAPSRSTGENGRVQRTIDDITQRVIDTMKDYEFDPNPENELIARRLCRDSQMQSVWTRLLRPLQGGHFRYPASLDGLNPFLRAIEYLNSRIERLGKVRDSESLSEVRWLETRVQQCVNDRKVAATRISGMTPLKRQEMACSIFYFAAFSAAAIKETVFTERDLSEAADYLRRQADTMEEASALGSILLNGEMELYMKEAVMGLRREAKLILAMPNNRLRVSRHRGDDTMRAFVIKMEETARRLFGQSLYGTIATVANVAFQRQDLTDKHVRELVRDRT